MACLSLGIHACPCPDPVVRVRVAGAGLPGEWRPSDPPSPFWVSSTPVLRVALVLPAFRPVEVAGVPFAFQVRRRVYLFLPQPSALGRAEAWWGGLLKYHHPAS